LPLGEKSKIGGPLLPLFLQEIQSKDSLPSYIDCIVFMTKTICTLSLSLCISLSLWGKFVSVALEARGFTYLGSRAGGS
jgi:hypothetical protein